MDHARTWFRVAMLLLPLALLAALVAARLNGVQAADGGLRAQLKTADGRTVGVVHLAAEDGQVVVRATLSKVPAGFHGFHIHALSSCEVGDPAAPFQAAGPHLGAGPGVAVPNHPGDMQSIMVQRDGSGTARFKTDRFKLKDVVGKPVILHAGPDNFANIPSARYESKTGGGVPDATTLATGDAGSRFACGLLRR